MCGRYVRPSDKQRLAAYFYAQPRPVELPLPDADYNIAPTTQQPIIRQSREPGERELVLARWGMVPFFTKHLKEVKGLSTSKSPGGDHHQGPDLAGAFPEAPVPDAGERLL